MDQGRAEFIGFLSLAVVLPVVAALFLARPIRRPLAAFAAVVVGSVALSAAAGEIYGVGLKLALARPETNWWALWIMGGFFGGVAGLAFGALRAIELMSRRAKAPDQGAAPGRTPPRWALLIAGCVLGTGLFAAVAVSRGPQRQGLTVRRAIGVNAGNFDRIGEGMSAEQVDAIFGVPPGDYRRPPGFLLVGPGHIPWSEAARGGRLAVWYVPGYHAEVLYDRDDRVVGKYWHDEEVSTHAAR